MIQYVEQFRPELDIEFLVVNVIVFEDRQVEISEAGSDRDIPSAIAQSCGWLRRGETLRFDVVNRVAGIHGIIAPGQLQAVREVEGRGIIHS